MVTITMVTGRYALPVQKAKETMITIATMTSNNPLLILAAMTLNGIYTIARWLANGVWGMTTTTTSAARVALLWSWRPLALFAGLVACVVLAALWWWVVVQLAGGAVLIAAFAYAHKLAFKH